SVGYGADKSTAKLLVRVRPVEAEIFIDGQHMGDATWNGMMTVPKISPGEHTVGIYNYGYVAQTFKVNFTGGQTSKLDVRLVPVAGTVSGPWGRIQIKDAPRAAILMNGKTPEYVVGHADETDNSFIWQQELLVRPGTYQLTLVHGDKTIWAGPVTVEAGKRTVLHAKTGTTHVENWKGGQPGNDLVRFRAGINTATIAVGPTTGNITAGPAEINCGDSSQLTWTSDGAVHTDISGIGDVAATGSQSVSPTATTTYTFTAGGPGGVVTPTATVTVNNKINASLEVAPPEITYERVGNQVKTQGTATVTWSATGGGAIKVTVDPFGAVDATGSRQVQPVPQQTGLGPVNETITYTLHATNQCGGDETRTATLHITGSIKPTEVVEEFSEVALVSLYFPTDYPTKQHPDGGLLKSQQDALNTLASAFKTYLGHDPNARLLLEAHADVRGSGSHNKSLTERRAARVKDYLVGQGIAASAIDMTAVGKENQLGKDEVAQLEAQNKNTPPKSRSKGKAAMTLTWMAYNRRVDVVLQPLGMRSSKYYPHAAADSSILWQRAKPSWKVVSKNQ
ncbi:MAG TPA: OmpA family protein, partial [Terriglobia bacterium]|nr:OmpA family protein [Terriglobia bacterium]